RPLPGEALVISEPLISIRYGNASWLGKSFEISMFSWPRLIWSFVDIPESAKSQVCAKEPWRSLGTLLHLRARGAFTKKEYAELLLNQGYRVLGTVRSRPTGSDHARTNQVPNAVDIVESDLVGNSALQNLLRRFLPNEVYNLAARASSTELWTDPVSTGDLNALAVVRLLDAIHQVDPSIRFAQASSSEVFGSAAEVPQSESTPFQPR